MTQPPVGTDPIRNAAPASTRPPAGGAEGRRARLARGARGAGLFGAGVVAALLAILGYTTVVPGPPPLERGDVESAIASALASVTPGPALSEVAYAGIRPSLVLIQAGPAADPATGTLGSGVVIDDAGDILTSLHVVDGAAAIRVTFADGTTSTAEIVASTPDSDTAVLQAATLPDGLQPAVLGNPGAMHVGSEAFVVGNPFGLVGSMSAGVVSGLDRTFTLPTTGREISGLIQVDAAVNPGNSGGPLLDRNGRVVGIVTALINPTKQDVFAGIGLAVPIDVAGGAAGLPQY
jgi:S1-C subfamily serine protease